MALFPRARNSAPINKRNCAFALERVLAPLNVLVSVRSDRNHRKCELLLRGRAIASQDQFTGPAKGDGWNARPICMPCYWPRRALFPAAGSSVVNFEKWDLRRSPIKETIGEPKGILFGQVDRCDECRTRNGISGSLFMRLSERRKKTTRTELAIDIVPKRKIRPYRDRPRLPCLNPALTIRRFYRPALGLKHCWPDGDAHAYHIAHLIRKMK